ncbi:MAG: enoyl-CoA hydratase/isomerase family protein [Alphaproteobacteria bacterium]|nr:enoyl-CoA hydratase/isomerase family protein [Alphaproteobacteria bacterium]
MSDTLLVAREGDVARVTINRPDKLNCMDTAMWRRMGELFAGFDADETLRCIVLGGAGGRAFCVGADIAEFGTTRANAEQARAYARLTHGALGRIAACRHPIVVAIRGLCVGGGLELACVADLRIATAGSRFGIPVKRLGLVVATTEMAPLIRLVGPANTKDILLTGDIFGAERALHMGLVNRVLPDDGFEAGVEAVVASIVEGAPLVARWHKKFADRLMDPRPLSDAEHDESYNCFDTEDFRIGSAAFLAKTKPAFKGR